MGKSLRQKKNHIVWQALINLNMYLHFGNFVLHVLMYKCLLHDVFSRTVDFKISQFKHVFTFRQFVLHIYFNL